MGLLFMDQEAHKVREPSQNLAIGSGEAGKFLA
jgi:hypothetical protein